MALAGFEGEDEERTCDEHGLMEPCEECARLEHEAEERHEYGTAGPHAHVWPDDIREEGGGHICMVAGCRADGLS